MKYANPRIVPFEAFVEQHMDLVDIVAHSFFPPPQGTDESEIRQSALLGLENAIKKYDPYKQAAFRTFASRVMENKVIDQIRSARSHCHRLTDAFSLDEMTTTEELETATTHELVADPNCTDPEDFALAAEWVEEFGKRYAELSQEQKRAYELIALDGLSRDKAAMATGRSEAHIKNKVQEARCYLRETVDVSPIG